jgi:hypothetical protein
MERNVGTETKETELKEEGAMVLRAVRPLIRSSDQLDRRGISARVCGTASSHDDVA